MRGERRSALAAALALAQVVAVLPATFLAGCATGAGKQGHICMPAVGMRTNDLAACGCRRYDGGAMQSLPVSRAAGGADAQTVTIVNYLCPLGDAGVAWATLINGVVDRVQY